MKKILILKGLPGSGKSTYAKELLKKEPGQWKRINKDDLRAMLDDGQFSTHRERFIHGVRDELIKKAVLAGYNVIVDDTNLHPRHEIRINEIAKELNGYTGVKVETEVQFLDVSLRECIERDSKRPHPVGAKVIKDFYTRFVQKEVKYPHDPALEDAIICDIDGTLAGLNGRNPYDASTCENDLAHDHIISILWKYSDSHPIFIVSGREDKYRPQTESWLKKHGVPYQSLYMRKTDDNRKDSIVKKEIFDQNIRDKYNVFFVLDDRDQVVDMWRNELGLKCLQVAEGSF